MPYTYLQPEQHYIDLYDLFTIKRCLDEIKTFQELYQRSLTDERLKDLSGKEKLESVNQLLYRHLLFVKTKEFERKGKAIKEWMDRDQKKQDAYDNTPEPKGIYCASCGAPMHSTFKTLEDFLDKPLRILFFFECSACKKRRGIYENGEERVYKPQQCTKCKKEVTITNKKEGEIITWTNTCTHCGYIETGIDDFEKSHAEWEQKQLEDQKLLAEYRTEYCLSEEEGKKHSELFEAMDVANVVYEEEVQKYDSSAYESASNLKKLGIVELEKLLSETLEKDQFIKFSLDKPEMSQYVIVPFSVQDANISRQKQSSTDQVQKILKETLADTNWRLMSDDVSCRLGYIYGRLKGHEREEDLMEISDQKKEKRLPKVSPEKMMKHQSHRVVRLAKMFGKHQGIENVRKRRLKKEPEGFYLEAGDGKIECRICNEYKPTDNI